jgi:putative ABC transport system substrate-binding protein
MSNRREFITMLGGGSMLAPFAASAQQAGRTYRLAFLSANPREAPQNIAFLDELRRYGFVEGQNFIVRGFNVRTEQFRDIVVEAIKQGVDAILCGGGPATRAAQEETRTIPILAVTDDMVAEGLVRLLAQPGANTTGVSILAPELDGKRQDILMEAVPGARRMAALADPKVQSKAQLQALREAAHARNIELSIHPIANAGEIAPAIDAAKASGAAALNVLATPLVFVKSPDHHRAHRSTAVACHVPMAGNCRGWRPHRLRSAHCPDFSAVRSAAGQGAARRQAC